MQLTATIVIVAAVAAVLGAVVALATGALSVVCWKTMCTSTASRGRPRANLLRPVSSSVEEPLIAPELAAANPESLRSLLLQLLQRGSASKASAPDLGSYATSAAFHNLCQWIGSPAAMQVVACEAEQIKLRNSWTSRATTSRMVPAGDVAFGGGVVAALLVDKRSDATIHRGAFGVTRIGLLRRGGFADEYVAVTVRSETAVAVAAEEAALLAAMPPHINVVRRVFFDAPNAPVSQPEWRRGMEVAELCAHSLSEPDLALRGAAFQTLLEHGPGLSLRIAQGVLNGLQHIHAQGLYHGNLKPASVLVSFSEWRTEEYPYGFDAKLSDFGVAASLNGTNVFSASSCRTAAGASAVGRGGAESVITGWRAPECYTVGREVFDVRGVALAGGAGSASDDGGISTRGLRATAEASSSSTADSVAPAGVAFAGRGNRAKDERDDSTRSTVASTSSGSYLPLENVSSFMYRYILRESCSQFDSLPLTSLTTTSRPRHGFEGEFFYVPLHFTRILLTI